MRLEDITDISQGIPLSRIRIDEGMEVEKRLVYSFEQESELEVPKHIKDIKQNIPLVEEGMILFNMVSYNAKKVVEEDVGKIIASNYVIVEVKSKKSKEVDSDYLAWYMDESESFKREIYRLKQGSAVLSLPINEFRKMKIDLPDMKIQSKIGRLSRLNKKRRQLFVERERLIEKVLITINEGELANG